MPLSTNKSLRKNAYKKESGTNRDDCCAITRRTMKTKQIALIRSIILVRALWLVIYWPEMPRDKLIHSTDEHPKICGRHEYKNTTQ